MKSGPLKFLPIKNKGPSKSFDESFLLTSSSSRLPPFPYSLRGAGGHMRKERFAASRCLPLRVGEVGLIRYGVGAREAGVLGLTRPDAAMATFPTNNPPPPRSAARSFIAGIFSHSFFTGEAAVSRAGGGELWLRVPRDQVCALCSESRSPDICFSASGERTCQHSNHRLHLKTGGAVSQLSTSLPRGPVPPPLDRDFCAPLDLSPPLGLKGPRFRLCLPTHFP